MELSIASQPWPSRLGRRVDEGRAVLLRPRVTIRQALAPASQRDMATDDEEGWLRGFTPLRKRKPAAETQLNGMRRSKGAKSKLGAPKAQDDEGAPAQPTQPALVALPSAPLPVSTRRRPRAGSASASEAVSAQPLPSSGSMHGMTCAQLRALARAHGVPTGGSKSELTRALLARARQEAAAQTQPAAGAAADAAADAAPPS
mmetsp:Transcript_38980/g.90282  ORF Transcript_38980/g.90282 Transcript_38980/m.90282 type:complete len:202 (+) Transcript_38980:96-701(+)